jgi:hypothetical protein
LLAVTSNCRLGDQPPVLSSKVFTGMRTGAAEDVGPSILVACTFGFTGVIRTLLFMPVPDVAVSGLLIELGELGLELESGLELLVELGLELLVELGCMAASVCCRILSANAAALAWACRILSASGMPLCPSISCATNAPDGATLG